MESTATIIFVGLVLFTSQSTLMNKTDATNPIGQTFEVAIMPTVVDPAQRQSHHMEPHLAMIAFQACDLIAVSGWEVKPLTGDFRYIELKHDAITFATNRANVQANRPQLGKVGGKQLLAPYEPPYSGASAVFRIAEGKLTTCRAGVDHQRIDTRLALVNQGTLTIKGDGGKSVTFAGNATVHLLNVPWLWPPNPSTDADQKHYTVYCAMTGDTECDFQKMRPDPLPDECVDPVFKTTGLSLELNAVDQFCSTTGWP
jgi:hypothetical protein